MATKETVAKVFAAVFFKFPNRAFTSEAQGKFITEIWEETLFPIPDELLLRVTKQYLIETKELYPNTDPFACIFSIVAPKKELFKETVGDLYQMIDKMVANFGYNREDEAWKWIEARSPLIASVMRRFGYQTYCQTETQNLGIARGQLRVIFEQEKKRAEELGRVVHSALELKDGKLAISQDQKIKEICQS